MCVCVHIGPAAAENSLFSLTGCGSVQVGADLACSGIRGAEGGLHSDDTSSGPRCSHGQESSHIRHRCSSCDCGFWMLITDFGQLFSCSGSLSPNIQEQHLSRQKVWGPFENPTQNLPFILASINHFVQRTTETRAGSGYL